MFFDGKLTLKLEYKDVEYAVNYLVKRANRQRLSPANDKSSLPMKDDLAIWEQKHLQYDRGAIAPDRFLDRYEELLEKARLPILDLACGTGSNSLYLVEKGKQVLACDFSPTALRLLKTYVPKADTLCFDLTKPFPLADESADVILCDMGLHFFDTVTTMGILAQMRRVLQPGGHVILRVNAMEDLAGKQVDRELEPHYYHVEDLDMRYFDRADLLRFFADWTLLAAQRGQMDRYRPPREIWHVLLQRP